MRNEANNRPHQASQPSGHGDHETIDQDLHGHAGICADERPGDDPGQSRQPGPDAHDQHEDERAYSSPGH